jgi:chromosome partitioning protein
VLQPYLGSSVKVKESHERSLPLIHLDPNHPLTQAYVQLYEGLPG